MSAKEMSKATGKHRAESLDVPTHGVDVALPE
jgi:hypothetical protein